LLLSDAGPVVGVAVASGFGVLVLEPLEELLLLLDVVFDELGFFVVEGVFVVVGVVVVWVVVCVVEPVAPVEPLGVLDEELELLELLEDVEVLVVAPAELPGPAAPPSRNGFGSAPWRVRY
jgi:hypothetical protein